jgi:hypothetical protein
MALLQKAYLGGTPLFKDLAWFEGASNTLVSEGYVTNVTGSASIHTKGSWSQIIASTAADASALVISVDGLNINNANSAALIDIGFGASGSEAVKIADIAAGGARGAGSVPFYGSLQFVVPFQVPSGTRISARLQGINASETAAVFVQAVDTGDYSLAPTAVDTFGGDTSTSTGLAMSGASGTWVEAIASTSQVYRGFVIVPSLNATTAINSLAFTYEIGTGASGSEASFGFINARYGSDESISNAMTAPTPVLGKTIAAGTRIAIKHGATSNPSLYQVTLIGIP